MDTIFLGLLILGPLIDKRIGKVGSIFLELRILNKSFTVSFQEHIFVRIKIAFRKARIFREAFLFPKTLTELFGLKSKPFDILEGSKIFVFFVTEVIP